MAVIIKYEKIMVRGERKVKILRVNALKEAQLPVPYTEDKRSFWLSKNESYLHFRAGVLLSEDSVISKEKFEEFVARIRAGGELLRKINQEVAKIASNWHGIKTLKI